MWPSAGENTKIKVSSCIPFVEEMLVLVIAQLFAPSLSLSFARSVFSEANKH
jgi:hypothetical protein